MKKPLPSSARGASFYTKHTLNANVVRVVLLDTNSYLALCKTYVTTYVSVSEVAIFVVGHYVVSEVGKVVQLINFSCLRVGGAMTVE
jgi:hypothetical protein